MEARTLVGLLLLLLASPAVAADRLDIYSKDGQRQGWAVVDEQTGRVDLYGKDGRRTGYGLARDDRLDLFDTSGRRQSTILRRDHGRDGRRP